MWRCGDANGRNRVRVIRLRAEGISGLSQSFPGRDGGGPCRGFAAGKVQHLRVVGGAAGDDMDADRVRAVLG